MSVCSVVPLQRKQKVQVLTGHSYARYFVISSQGQVLSGFVQGYSAISGDFKSW